MKIEAIVPAAGLGLRMKSFIPKPLIKIANKPILILTLESLTKNNLIKRIIVAVPAEFFDRFRLILNKFHLRGRVELVVGGETRKRPCSIMDEDKFRIFKYFI